MAHAHGRFCWYDLVTTDVAAAKAFYTEVFGWKTAEWDESEQYTHLQAAGAPAPFGGMMTLPDTAKAMGAPPHWLAYVDVHDVAATAKRAEALGGKVHQPPTDIPKTGQFAVIADPQGAALGIFTGLEHPAHAEPEPATLVIGWNELNTTDWQAARAFYAELFGWEDAGSHDMGPEMGVYAMFGMRGAAYGGMSDCATAMHLPPHWLPYAQVPDLDGALGRITAKGGQILNGPMEVPGGTRIAQCMDPQGVAFALMTAPAGA